MTAAFLLASLILCVAGAAKLRAPQPAAEAIGWPAAAVRVFAGCELALGAWCALAPTRLGAALMGCTYAVFAAVALRLSRRHAECGCFGETASPTSPAHSLLSLALAAVCLVAAITAAAHGVGWLFKHPVTVVVPAALGLLAAVYATVLAYTALPQAWGAWSGQR